MAIEISARQRDRLERIKEECTDDGSLPKPTDSVMLDSLMDTWDAVDGGLYSQSASKSASGGDDG